MGMQQVDALFLFTLRETCWSKNPNHAGFDR